MRIFTQTVRNRLHEFGLNDMIPVIRIPLTRQHVQDKLDSDWTLRDWTPVLFTDESRFCIDFTDTCRRQLVWRMSKERFDELNVAEHGHMARAQL